MRVFRTASACWRLTWLPCALLTLAGCTPQTIYRDRPVQVPVPVPTPVPAELVADCQPEPLAGTSIGQVLDHARSVDGCLEQMRVQARALREPK